MRSIPPSCSDGRVARARQGLLSPAEWQEFVAHLATCADCRITWRLMVDFEQSAAPAPGDERILGRAAKLALAGSLGRRAHGFRVGVAAAVTLVVAGAASGAMLLRDRHLATSPELAKPARSAGTRASRAAGSLAAQPVESDEHAAFLTSEPTPALPAPVVVAQAPRSAHAPPKAMERATRHLAIVARQASPPAIAREPALPVEDAASLFARALSEREQGRTSVAAATFRSLQNRFSQTPQAVLSWVSLADLLLGTGDAGAALVAFDKYLAAAPSGTLVPEALLGKARALSALGRASEADAVWREISRRYPESPYVGRRVGTRPGSDTP